MGETLTASLLVRGAALLGALLVLVRRSEGRRGTWGFGVVVLALGVPFAVLEAWALLTERHPREEYPETAAILNALALGPSLGSLLLVFDRSEASGRRGGRWVFGALAALALGSMLLHLRFSGA